MLGKLPVLGRPTKFDHSRARAYSAYSRCGWGLFDIFTLVFHFFFLSPSLCESARLQYRLKGSLIPRGWSGGAMVLGKLPVPGRPTYLVYSRARASLSPDPFFASLFSFLFVRDTNLAHPIKNCSLHSLV